MGHKSRRNMTGLSLEERVHRSELARKAEEELQRRLRVATTARLLEVLATAKKQRYDEEETFKRKGS